MNNENGFSGKTAVVTGGAGGLGRAIVGRLLAAGADVLAVDIDGASLAKLSADLPAARTLTQDIRSADGPANVLAATGGVVDILFNNAGILDGLQLIDEVDEDRFDDVLAVNLRAPFRLCRAVLPGMVERGGGVIINTASLAGLKGGRAGAAYTTSKWGLIGLTKSIANGRGWTRLAGIPIAPFRVVGRTLVYRGWPIRDDLEQDSEGSWSGRGFVLGREFCRFRLVRPPGALGA